MNSSLTLRVHRPPLPLPCYFHVPSFLPPVPHLPHPQVGAPGASSVRRGRHSAGNVTGWTAIEFLALPARAQLSVTYEGEQNAQGFISFRKL